MIEPRAPQHAFEVRVSIGGNTWEYVQRAIRELLEMVESREANEVGCSSGSWDGCHSIDVALRDVTPERYREELEEWRQKIVAAQAARKEQDEALQL